MADEKKRISPRDLKKLSQDNRNQIIVVKKQSTFNLLIVILFFVMLIVLIYAVFSNYKLIEYARNANNMRTDPYQFNVIDYTDTFSSGPTSEVEDVVEGESFIEGKLSISNIATNRGRGVGNSNFLLSHIIGAEEGLGDSYSQDSDTAWADVPSNPYDKWLIAYSNPYGVELTRDSRPANSLTSVEVILAVIFSRDESGPVSTNNSLKISVNEPPYDFSGQDVYIQQTYPVSNIGWPVYNIKELIANQNGTIVLPELDDDYTNGEIYAKFLITFQEV